MINSSHSIWRGVFFVVTLSILSAWPMLFVSAPLVYFDTFTYLGMGEKTISMAKAMLVPPSDQVAGSGPATDGVKAVRAVSYSVYLFMLSKTLLGLVLPVLIQTALTLGMLLSFVKESHWHKHSFVALFTLLGLSTLPWIGSYAMPDIFAASVIIWSAVLIRRLDELDWISAIALTLIASFAVSSHYGHIPLAIVLIAFVLCLRLVQKRISLRLIILAPLPVVMALLVNLTASTIALDQASFAPKRLPILLARSLEDGPAAWFLEEHCAEASFAMCEVFGDNVPKDISQFLWAPGGIKSISSETLDVIRAEETAFLIAAFKKYPTAQLWSFAGNAMLQIVTIGTGELHPLSHRQATEENAGVGKFSNQQAAILNAFDWITKAGTLLALVAVLLLWKRKALSETERDLALMIILGLIVNAIIFGGLSAPVDRYQSRVAWLLPALWFIHAARQRPSG